MEVIYPRCCGLDVHKQTVVACPVTPGPNGIPCEEVRTSSTMAEDLAALAAWLGEAGCTHAALESTGGLLAPRLGRAGGADRAAAGQRQARQGRPGAKTDVRDCEWLADLLRHGLLRGSAVPDRPRRELRELTRYRSALVQERAAAVNRLQKTLEGAGIKPAAVATDLTGVSARAMLAALAELARGRLRAKLPELRRALDGHFGAHHRFPVAEIQERKRPLAATVARLDAIPGIGRRAAEILLAELGTELSHFPSARHCASWAGLCPGNHESAGKRRSGRTRKGNSYLRAIPVECALAAGRARTSYPAAQYRRLVRRLGEEKAAVAVAHTLLVIIYHLLTTGAEYHDLGYDYFDRLDRDALERRHVRGLERLGYRVALEKIA